MIAIQKLAKILRFITKDPYLPLHCDQLRYSEQQDWRHVQLNGVIQYNAPLNGNCDWKLIDKDQGGEKHQRPQMIEQGDWKLTE